MRPELVEDTLLPLGVHLERADPAIGSDEGSNRVVRSGVRPDDDEVRAGSRDLVPNVRCDVVLGDDFEIGLGGERLPNDLAQQRWHVYEHDPDALQQIPPTGIAASVNAAQTSVNGPPDPTWIQP